MTRLDLYGPVHKGLRALLFDTAAHVARTEFASAEETVAALTAVRRARHFLEGHIEHEDHDVMPVIARLAPELFADLEADHARVTGLEQELDRIVERVEAAHAAERVALGRKLCERFTRLVAEHVIHMEREESQANRVLWAHLGDGELAALEGKIVGSIPADELAGWLTLMLPATNLGERAGILARMSTVVPAEVIDRLTSEARWLIGPEGWDATVAAVASLRNAESIGRPA
ncbi:MAG: hemerythrin domain-containing protein [Planctomycetes bacterium]|nr:hemerythrin domain-containing protein [Planctomycetota bacterium]